MMNNLYDSNMKFPVHLSDTITMLGNYFFNLYVIRGNKKTALYECGVTAVIDTVIEQLDELGIQPDYIIPAHPHSDHITGLPGLMNRYPKAEVISGEGSRRFIEHPKAGPAMFLEDAFISRRMAEEGFRPGRSPLDILPDLSGCLTVSGNRTLSLGDISLELIKAEGHSPGNLICFFPEERVLFSSDSLGFHYPGRGFFPLFFTTLAGYLYTFGTMKSLNPFMICPAHQGPLMGKDVGKAFHESQKATDDMIHLIQTYDKSQEELTDFIFQESYIDEFTLYTGGNIRNCAKLLIKRVRETSV